MISKFFIERPVLSNVIALLMVLIGGVALFKLPVAQYPDVVPPTVQVTTRYPGASAKTVIDTVALPIEQQVNGVEDMLYMQSYAAADGTYTLTVTFKIGTDLNFAQVLVQNRVSSALSQLPQAVQNQGVTVQKKSTSILLFVDADLARQAVRQPLPGQLRHHQFERRVVAAARRRQRHGVRRRAIFDADLARSQQAAGARTDAAGRDPGDPAAEPAGDGRPGRRAADAAGPVVPIHAQRQRPARRCRASSRTSSSRPAATATSRACATSAAVELGAQTYGQIFTLNKQPAAGHRRLPVARRQRARRRHAVETKMAELAKRFPQGIIYDTPFDTTKFV